MKRKTIASKHNLKTHMAHLDVLRLKFKKLKTGYRSEVYRLMGEAQNVHFALRRNSQLRKDFIRKVNRERTDPGPMNLATEIMALVMGAKSRASRQLAWKRGRVLELLREDRVKPEKTAKEIKKRGGIEKIIASAKIPPSSSNQVERKAAATASSRSAEDALPKSKSRSNDGVVPVLVLMRLSDRDEILEARTGSRVSMSALKIGQKQAELKITRIEVERFSNDEEEENEDE